MSLKKSIENLASNFPVKNKAFLKVATVIGAGVVINAFSGGLATAALSGYALYEYANGNHSPDNLKRLGLAAAASLFAGPVLSVAGVVGAAVYGVATYKMIADKRAYYGEPAEQKLIKKMTSSK